jgi:hypothetical protein
MNLVRHLCSPPRHGAARGSGACGSCRASGGGGDRLSSVIRTLERQRFDLRSRHPSPDPALPLVLKRWPNVSSSTPRSSEPAREALATAGDSTSRQARPARLRPPCDWRGVEWGRPETRPATGCARSSGSRHLPVEPDRPRPRGLGREPFFDVNDGSWAARSRALRGSRPHVDRPRGPLEPPTAATSWTAPGTRPSAVGIACGHRRGCRPPLAAADPSRRGRPAHLLDASPLRQAGDQRDRLLERAAGAGRRQAALVSCGTRGLESLSRQLVVRGEQHPRRGCDEMVILASLKNRLERDGRPRRVQSILGTFSTGSRPLHGPARRLDEDRLLPTLLWRREVPSETGVRVEFGTTAPQLASPPRWDGRLPHRAGGPLNVARRRRPASTSASGRGRRPRAADRGRGAGFAPRAASPGLGASPACRSGPGCWGAGYGSIRRRDAGPGSWPCCRALPGKDGRADGARPHRPGGRPRDGPPGGPRSPAGGGRSPGGGRGGDGLTASR